MADPNWPVAAGRESGFRERLIGGQPLLGTFQKTAAPQIVEILGSVGFDFVVVDQEHAPLGREAVDSLLLAAKARNLPALVRIAHIGEAGNALDCGADGIMAPHVRSAAEARDVVAACRYVGGRRGYSNSPRAGDYGRIAMAEHIRSQDAAAAVVVTIEDVAAIAQVEAILAVDGVDAILIGCADLAVSLGESSPDTPKLRQIVQQVSVWAAEAGRRALAPVSSISTAKWLIDLGMSAFVVSSDQGLLRAGAGALCRDFSKYRNVTSDGST